MFPSLRSLLLSFLTLGSMLSALAPAGADELMPPRQRTVTDAPPLPRPRSNDAQLQGLRGGLVSGSKTAHPNVNVAGTTQSPQSIQAVRQETQIPAHFSSPGSVQASFTTRPMASFDSAVSEEPLSQKQPEELFDEYAEPELNAPNAMLDKSLFSKKSAKETENADEDGESKASGWTNKLSKPELTPVISIAGSLLIVVAAFFLLVIFFRKVSPQGNRPLPKEAFECLGRYFLTQKHQLQVLRLGNRIVLVSVMPDGVSALAEIADPDEAVSFLGLCRRLDTDSATEVFRRTVARMSEDELSRPHERPVAARQKKQSAASLDLTSDPDESLAAILARGRHYGR